MTDALITPEELADLEAKVRLAEQGEYAFDVDLRRAVPRLIATIRAVTARAEAAEKERDELREALRPFADNWCESLMSDVSNDEIVTMKFDRVSSFTLMSGHLRRAARLLPAEPDHGEV